MKHFIIEICYQVPVEQLGEIVREHRAYLQQGYELGWLLCSGPQNPKTGGIVVARAPSRAEIETFFAKDPFHLKQVATHRIIEFNPVMKQDILNTWINE